MPPNRGEKNDCPMNTTMRRLTTLLLLVAALRLTGFSQKVQLPPRTRHTLENGLTVVLVEYKRVPLVYYRLVAHGGSADDPTGQEGLAAMATALMRQGTATRSAPQIAEAIDFIGGSLSAAAGLEYCAVQAEVLTKDTDTGLDLFSDVILHPTFPQDELERERKQRLAFLESMKEDPATVASMAFTKGVYQGHPYGIQTVGTKASIGVISRDNLDEFHRRIFVPNNCVLVVVGDFQSSELLGKIRQTFGGWQAGTAHQVTLPAPRMLTGRHVLLVDKPDATQIQIVAGNIGIDIKHPDAFAVKVANTVLGVGFTSRLMEALRVKRCLTYGVASSFPSNLFGGTYVISTYTKNESVKEMLDAMLGEVKKFRDQGATRDEVKKAQNFLAGSFARGLQTPEALATRLTDTEIYGFSDDYVETYIERLRAVSLDDVRRVAREHFPLDDLLLVLVAPVEQVRAIAGQYGEVSVTEIQDVIR
jgi:zinc protease